MSLVALIVATFMSTSNLAFRQLLTLVDLVHCPSVVSLVAQAQAVVCPNVDQATAHWIEKGSDLHQTVPLT